MSKFDYGDLANKYQRESNYSDDYFTMQEGANKMRIMSGSEPISEHFKKGVCIGQDKGCTYHNEKESASLKFLTWIIDRKDNTLKQYKMPYTIVKQIAALQLDPEYAFEEVPMPYDVTINAKNAGKMEVEYTLTAARSNSPIEANLLEEFTKKTDVREIVNKMKINSAKKQGIEYSSGKSDYDQSIPDSLPVIKELTDAEQHLEDIPF